MLPHQGDNGDPRATRSDIAAELWRTTEELHDFAAKVIERATAQRLVTRALVSESRAGRARRAAEKR